MGISRLTASDGRFMRASEWKNEIGIGYLSYMHVTKVFVLCEYMKVFLENVEKDDYKIIKYEHPGYLIWLIWSGKGTNMQWNIPFKNISNICERIVNND